MKVCIMVMDPIQKEYTVTRIISGVSAMDRYYFNMEYELEHYNEPKTKDECEFCNTPAVQTKYCDSCKKQLKDYYDKYIYLEPEPQFD